MRKLFVTGLALAMAASAYAAPNVTNNTQKGSLLIFPDIDVRNGNTVVRLQNDGSLAVDVKCIWMDGNKNRVDFIITLTKNQPVWFEAKTGTGVPYQVNRFPSGSANGFDNPFLPGGAGPFGAGLLVCFAVDEGAMNQVKWNHLSGTATVVQSTGASDVGAYEYTAYAFFIPTGFDQAPVGTAGTLNLNGVEYDSCPLYQIGQLSPIGSGTVDGIIAVNRNRLALAGCDLDLNQDWRPIYTKYQFDVWTHQEVKYTGTYECADSWHETFFSTDLDAGAQNFDWTNLASSAVRYRVQGTKSTQCAGVASTVAVGVVAIQSSNVRLSASDNELVGTSLTAAGKFTGKVKWDPEGAVPEGRQ